MEELEHIVGDTYKVDVQCVIEGLGFFNGRWRWPLYQPGSLVSSDVSRCMPRPPYCIQTNHVPIEFPLFSGDPRKQEWQVIKDTLQS